MNRKQNPSKKKQDIYDCIVVGAGAAGLFYAASDTSTSKKLLLEKTSRPGHKLLMSGGGMCNITHGGSIKDFIRHYGKSGTAVRSCLYKNNNIKLMQFIENHGVPLYTRDDGKVFPVSKQAKDILDMLLAEAKKNNFKLRTNSPVVSVRILPEQSDPGMTSNTVHPEPENRSQMASVTEAPEQGDPDPDTRRHLIRIQLEDGTSFTTKKLVIAVGGASYPATGSDGNFIKIWNRDLGIETRPLRPALAPVFIKNYAFSQLAGVSLDRVTVTCGGHTTEGPLLFTHKGLSGPAIMHISQYVKSGDILEINFLPEETRSGFASLLKKAQPGNKKSAANYISQEFSLPKAMSETIVPQPDRKLSALSSRELEDIAARFIQGQFPVSRVGGWNEAMVTAGGVALNEMNLKNMSLTRFPQIRVIGEALDINGDTGGYNLQFAYSSACAALD